MIWRCVWRRFMFSHNLHFQRSGLWILKCFSLFFPALNSRVSLSLGRDVPAKAVGVRLRCPWEMNIEHLNILSVRDEHCCPCWLSKGSRWHFLVKLTWRLLWSRSQNHLGQAVKKPLPHFSDGEYFLLNLSNIGIWSDDQQLIFCCQYISIGQNFWGIIESNRHQNQITQCARFESIGFACFSLLMNTSDARIGKVIRI